jgi:hypothetical protein
MSAFYVAHRPEHAILAQAVRELGLAEFLPPSVAEIPWGYHVVLLERVKDPTQRLWYAYAALEHGWNRGLLMLVASLLAHGAEPASPLWLVGCKILLALVEPTFVALGSFSQAVLPRITCSASVTSGRGGRTY